MSLPNPFWRDAPQHSKTFLKNIFFSKKSNKDDTPCLLVE